MLDDLNEIIGDAGYLGMSKRQEWQDRKEVTTFSISERPGKVKKLSSHRKELQHQLSSLRSTVEHAFFRVKCQFKFRKTPYKGQAKLENRIAVILAVGNLIAGDNYIKAHPMPSWANCAL